MYGGAAVYKPRWLLLDGVDTLGAQRVFESADFTPMRWQIATARILFLVDIIIASRIGLIVRGRQCHRSRRGVD